MYLAGLNRSPATLEDLTYDDIVAHASSGMLFFVFSLVNLSILHTSIAIGESVALIILSVIV